MKRSLGRRSFLRGALGAALVTPALLSWEERALLAAQQQAPAKTKPATRGAMPTGKIGKITISRLICGGNLVSGFAHSRDLIYVAPLLKRYFTEEKIMETWALCEEHGINTMVVSQSDPRAEMVYRKYVQQGGTIQYIAQIRAEEDNLDAAVKKAVDGGAVGAFLHGGIGDVWVRDGKLPLIGMLIEIIKEHGLIAGVAGHELRTIREIEKAGFEPDFYVKTLHHTNYWSFGGAGEKPEVIRNRADNYWCRDPQETIEFMATVRRPWIAYKVLAAGAIRPREGFQFAFANGADFALVGMFDFQIREDVEIANAVLAKNQKRSRAWMA
ncbi:MAG: hypothetical protein N3B01_04205 [Verrucomicrobiae bacterium]|nr:hypothetical protein [Verrucomicrobiae bacterium]